MLTKVVKQVAASHIFKEEVDSELILKDVVHGENERVFGLEEDVLFSPGVNNLALFDEDILINSFHCILLAILAVDNQEHFAE